MKAPISDALRVQAVTLMAEINRPPPQQLEGQWNTVASYSWGGPVLATLNAGYPVAGLQGSWECHAGAAVNVADGKWHHIAMTHTADGTLQLFVDGEHEPIHPSPMSSARPGKPLGTSTPAAEITCGEPTRYTGEYLYIGSDAGFEFFSGDIRNLRISDYALTHEEIREIAANP